MKAGRLVGWGQARLSSETKTKGNMQKFIIVLEHDTAPVDAKHKSDMIRSMLRAFGMSIVTTAKADAEGLAKLAKILGVVQEMNSTEKEGEKV